LLAGEKGLNVEALLSLFAFFVVLSLLVFFHELGHFIVAKRAGVQVEEFGFGYPPRLIRFWQHKGTEYTINAIPFGGFVRMRGEEDPNVAGGFANKDKKTRIAVLCAGAAMNLVLACFVAGLNYSLGAPYPVAFDNTMVVGIAPNSPAATAGLQVGDLILKVNDQAINKPDELKEHVAKLVGQEITLEVKRGTEIFRVSLVPRVNPPESQGAMGVSITAYPSKIDIRRYPVPQAMLMGAREILATITLTMYAPVALIRGLIPLEAARPVGPVGIYQLTGSAVQQSVATGWWYPILRLTSLLSTALAITNLLPLPALDGGRIFFVLVEAVRGRRVDPQREGAIHFIGLAALIALLLIVSYYDISRPLPIIDWTSLF
jgi:regulator of sigma E protease